VAYVTLEFNSLGSLNPLQAFFAGFLTLLAQQWIPIPSISVAVGVQRPRCFNTWAFFIFTHQLQLLGNPVVVFFGEFPGTGPLSVARKLLAHTLAVWLNLRLGGEPPAFDGLVAT
jgi:hypothetical protein